MNPYLVGISGGSASGKTHVLDRIRKAFTEQELTLISQDNYYKDLKDQVPDENGDINFDHPNAMNLDLFADHMGQIVQGNAVQIREYVFNNPNRVPAMITYNPSPIVVVEGLFVFHNKEVRNSYNLKIFVDADEHIRLTRRILRDNAERGYSLETVLTQYTDFVIPMYRLFVEPYKSECDLAIINNKHIDTSIDVIINHFRAIIQKK